MMKLGFAIALVAFLGMQYNRGLFQTLTCSDIVPLPALDNWTSIENHVFGSRLAIIIPFTAKDLDRLETNIRHWSDPLIFPACMPSKKYGNFIDIVFLFNRRLDLDTAVLDRLKQLEQRTLGQIQQCIRNVRYVSASLTAEEDQYPFGPSNMFWNLFNTRQLLAQYHAFYWMEPDNYPCRARWIDRLYEELALDAEFWMKGSLLRDVSDTRNPDYETYTFREHLNGNALYRLSSSKFRDFMAKVQAEWRQRPQDFVSSFDIAIERVLRNTSIIPWVEYVNISHRFKLSGFIQNVYRARVNKTELCQQWPETYFVHGRNVFW